MRDALDEIERHTMQIFVRITTILAAFFIGMSVLLLLAGFKSTGWKACTTLSFMLGGLCSYIAFVANIPLQRSPPSK